MKSLAREGDSAGRRTAVAVAASGPDGSVAISAMPCTLRQTTDSSWRATLGARRAGAVTELPHQWP
ncbi:hypothetical protein GCM10023214_10320 [Amycolatopsis dongchuanensis]|uniref:Uncharacterized protein n=1 Tax=Amycolatopsis dongchuanensis TaxID=1070866 RepID=A0ABP9Q734_9PSEU